jgi:tetratricopeptide (TPR) repeat protein
MLTSKIRNRLILYFVLFSFIACYGQGSGLTEEDVIRKAQTLFDRQEYKEAMPLFAQLVSIHPSNPEYNYKFGVCALFGDRSDRRRPIRYLNNALKTMGDDPGLSYHLGQAYYQNQEFSNAMRFFNLYLGKLGPESRERPPILEKINACLNGLNLEHTNVIDEIISKSEFKTDNFHRAYRADDFNGMLVLKPENFVTPYEKKTGQNSFVFIAEPRDVLYFSGYEANSTQKDIFRVTLNEKGDWGKPEKLPDVINTNYDEDYPVVVDNGNTLYFSSKGHNSVGGYDIFKATFNPETNTFSTPENLGVGVNSPFDDFLFIPDKTGNFAWFASDRENLNGALSVYKIRLNDKYAHQDKLMAVHSTPGISNQTEKTDVVFESPKEETSGQTASSQIARTSDPEMTPAERAARLKTERDMVNKLADTSYMLVTETRNLIRDIGNKRDRANSVTENKREAVKTLEVKFEELTTSMAGTTSRVEFERQLENAINLKREIYQYRMRADEANLIAWNLGKQLRIKNEEFEKLKTSAGNVQTNSMSGKVEDTRIAFLELKSVFNVSDTLTDYTNQLMSISSDEKTYDVPEAELAFASDLRKGFETNTLLAQNKKPEAIQKNEDIPIVVVDKRTQPVTVKQPEKPSVNPVRQVEQVVIESQSVAMNFADHDQPVVRFEIDAIQPVNQVIPVRYEPLAFNPGYPENDLVVDLEFGFPDAYPQVEQVFANATTQYPEWDDNIEINLAADIIEPLALVTEVAPEDYTFNVVEETPVINHSVDAVQAEPVIAQIEYDAGNNNIELHDEELNLALQTEALRILELVKQVIFDENAYALAFNVEDDVDIVFEERSLKAYEIVQPIDVNLFAFNLPIGESDIHIVIEPEMIQKIEALQTAQVIEIPERLKEGLAFGIEETILVLEDKEVELIALTHQVMPHAMTGVILDEEDIVLYVEAEKIYIIPVVIPVELNPLVYNGIRMDEENANVWLEVDKFITIAAFDLVDEIIIPEFPDNFYTYLAEETELRIEDVPVAELIVSRQVEPVTMALKEIILPSNDSDFIEINFYSDEPGYSNDLIAQFSGISASVDNTDSINLNKNINADILFLRESVSLANDIETTRSDAELIKLALTEPDNLEYEELLYAASLATNPKDKILIYNSAFIHIDRDWRAFNNAGVTSLGIKDLDQAECLLYQASLISDNNGKILNNMGILACLKNDYKAAGNHFIAASQMGVNAEYNMQVLNNMANGSQFNTDQLRKEIGEHKYKLDLRKR